MSDPVYIKMNNLRYCCTDHKMQDRQQFIGEHTLVFIIAGETQLQSSEGIKTLRPGCVALIGRNQLIRSVNIPPSGGEFQSVSILLNQAFLRKYVLKEQISSIEKYTGDEVLLLPSDELLTGYFESLLPYFRLDKPLIAAIADLKTLEALELLLNLNRDLARIVFDFTAPEKADLADFMNRNFIYNVHTAEFARLSGRSLATFKRDFQKIFEAPPGQWLLDRRLKEAYHLIKDKYQKPSDVYLQVGFENLSHFSFAFKSAFGVLPSKL
jgi:AraC-like DNA-binding protein